MIDILRFIADYSGMNLADALKEAYEQGKRDARTEREKGKWIANGDIHKECPFCGEDWDKYVFGEVWYTGELPNFCPNCGADMRGEADG